jgi:hypothetical protein
MFSLPPIGSPTRETVQAQIDHFSSLVTWATVVVAAGVALEGVELIHDAVAWIKKWRLKKKELADLSDVAEIFPALEVRSATESRKSDHPGWVKVFTRIGLIAVVIGVVGEWRFGAKLEDAHNTLHGLDMALLVEAQKEAGDAKKSAEGAASAAASAKTSADNANLVAGSALDKSKEATDAASKAQEKVEAVAGQAGDIEAGLAQTQLLVSARFIADPSSLMRELKQFEGQAVVLISYAGDKEGSGLCAALFSLTHSAGMLPADECGTVFAGGHLLSEITVSGPDVQATQTLGRVISSAGGFFVISGITAPNLTIFVGVKSPFIIGQARGVPAKKQTKKQSAKP